MTNLRKIRFFLNNAHNFYKRNAFLFITIINIIKTYCERTNTENNFFLIVDLVAVVYFILSPAIICKTNCLSVSSFCENIIVILNEFETSFIHNNCLLKFFNSPLSRIMLSLVEKHSLAPWFQFRGEK